MDTPVSIKVNPTSNENIISGKNSYNYIYEAVKDSVVTIQTDKGRGSGVIVTSDGHIVTNEHVIRQAQIVNIITTDNKIYPAKIIGVDSITDIALLHSSYEGKSITFSDSTLVKIGDIVLFGKWSGTEVKIDGKEYSIMKESDIMGISKSKK